MVRAKSDLDLRKLEIFHWVAEFRSFSDAAEHLSLRQPTVSAHVRELEEKLGAKLFNRVGGKVTPTPMGRLLLDSAKRLLELKRNALDSLDHFQDRIRGELLIGGSNIPGEYILPRRLAAFVQQYPEVKPTLRIGDSAGIVEAVVEGEVEIGFVGFKGEDGRLAFQKIWKDEMVLAVPRNHPWGRLKAIGLKDLRKEGFISREGGSGTLRSFRRLLARKGYDPDEVLRVTMELGSTEAIKEALIAGYGVSILSRTSIQREIRAGLLREVPIRGLRLERNFYQITHRQRSLSPVSQAFIQFLKHHSPAYE
jgi:DNA-binding transcriptional LysR family regulator